MDAIPPPPTPVPPRQARFVAVALLAAGVAALLFDAPGAPPALGQPPAPAAPRLPVCVVRDRLFEEGVWAKVGERTCLKCHNEHGDAADSGFLLKAAGEKGWLAHNLRLFEKFATAKKVDEARLLVKATGGLDHGGGRALKPGSPAHQVLARFVRRANGIEVKAPDEPAVGPPEGPFFAGVTMLPPDRLLRRVTLSLAARLPTPQEVEAVRRDGLGAFPALLDAVMREEAFYARLKEGFNDVFLTLGIEDNAESLLSYDHFEKTRHWTEKHDLSKVPEAERQKARWGLARVYREALLREPLELVAHIVRNDRPFTELVTADSIMVSPYTARGYGIFDDVKAKFKNPDEPFEFVPAQLKALRNRAGQTQESRTGLYPHAGFLSMFHYLRRYPTTDTNRNRLRARMFYQHFLGVDVMQLAPRVTDAAAVSAKFKTPTMEAADCVVCHKTIDSVAGVFQDFDKEGHLGPRKGGWYTDMFPPGFEGEALPAGERWRAPQWLAERAVKGPRFPVAMVEHVYYILMGRRPLLPPEDVESPLFAAQRRAYRAQRALIEGAAARLAQSGFNLKVAFQAIILSEFYRADGLAEAAKGPHREAELDDVGVVRLLSPEQLDRKLAAVFGKPWKRLDGDFRLLYGGIDSQTVTERNAEPSGAMGAIQRMMANDVACEHVARDFRLPPEKRVLFPGIEPSVTPVDEKSRQAIRAAVVHLHRRVSGRDLPPTHPEVERTYQLFTGVLADAKAQGKFEPRETYFCGGREGPRMEDPHYTVRAWRAVVTYLLRRHDFLYE